jgi:hypothetical protein
LDKEPGKMQLHVIANVHGWNAEMMRGAEDAAHRAAKAADNHNDREAIRHRIAARRYRANCDALEKLMPAVRNG